MQILSALVCDPVQIFDLTFGGLVVFGERVSKLMPEWWGVYPGDDHAEPIQHAIDAGLHHRINRWEEPSGLAYPSVVSYGLPPIPVELRDGYRVDRPIEVRGGLIKTRLLDILGARGMRNVEDGTVVLSARYDTRNAADELEEVVPKVEVPSVVGDPGTRVTFLDPFGGTYDASLIEVELLGNGTSVRITSASSRLKGSTDILLRRVDGVPVTIRVRVEFPARETRQVLCVANLVLEGVWQGRSVQGAQLTALPDFQGDAMLRLVNTGGLTLRTVTFSAKAVPGLTCLKVAPPREGAPSYMQGMTVRRCTFEGTDANLVELGPVPELIPPASPVSVPIARVSNFSADISGIAFDECESWPVGHAVALSVRTQESLPFRVRRCVFTGDADAMIVAWRGSFHIDRCRFANTRRPSLEAPSAPGFAEPDGVDIYLKYEPMQRGTDPSHPVAGAQLVPGTLAAFTASGCVSKSPMFFSTPRVPLTANAMIECADRQIAGTIFVQFTTWPVLLLNARHLPDRGASEGVSVRWHLRPGNALYVQHCGASTSERLGPEVPLVVVGGQYAGKLNTSYGAAPAVVFSARALRGGQMPIFIDSPPRGVSGYLRVFAMRYDQDRW